MDGPLQFHTFLIVKRVRHAVLKDGDGLATKIAESPTGHQDISHGQLRFCMHEDLCAEHEAYQPSGCCGGYQEKPR
ncbi:hypothetical protein EMIT0P265_580002 [Pseudomonas zeae]